MKHSFTLSALFSVLLTTFSISVNAQQFFGIPHGYECSHDGCGGLIGTGVQYDHFTPPPADFVPGAERDVIISVDYNGFTPNAQAAFQYAVDLWAATLTSDLPIQIEANWENIGGGVLGFAGAANYFINFAGAPEANTYYPAALADKIAGFDQDPGAYDITCTFNSGTNWYFGTDGNPGGGQYDFVTVVLHELGHGLGVVGSPTVDNGIGFWQFGQPGIYDVFVENGAGTWIYNFNNGTTSLANQLTSDNLFWNGSVAVGNNSGIEPKLFAPDSWNGGSSYSHLDEGTYPPGTGDNLMTPFLAPGEAIHDVGPIILGLLEDIGWTVGQPEPCTDALYLLTMSPDCFGGEVTWEVEDSQGTVVVSGGPYVDVLPEDLQTYFEELCLEAGCYTFTVFDSFGDGLAGSEEGSCGVDGDFFITDPNGNVVVVMGPANYGDMISFEICVDAVPGCTDPNAANYNPNATVDDGSCTYSGGCVVTAIEVVDACVYDEVNQEFINQVEVIPTINGSCFAQELCFAPAGGGAEECFFLPDFNIELGDGGSVFLTLDNPGTYDLTLSTENGVSAVTTFTIDCATAVTGCGNPFATNYSPLVEVNIESLCEYDTFICDCAGTQHTAGVMTWLGDGFADTGDFNWNDQPVDFNCDTWGFDCGDIGPTSDPFGVCDGNLPPNNGCSTSSCAPLDLTITQEPCIDTGDGFGILPAIGFDFDINGTCTVTELCVQSNGGGYDCYNLADLGITADNDNGILFTNTTAGATYEIYYVTNDGVTSPVFTWVNGDCENEVTICDCAGTQHSIGVLAWLGDDFADTGGFDWDGQPVDFNCSTWGFDCGDIGPTSDPFGVCDGNLPPNNGCVGEIAGCTDPTALNYDPSATINDGSCIYDIEGCTDLLACNYDPEATVNNGSCDYSCYGCTNVQACNYDPTATLDDNSCEFDSCAGCTDPAADNYDPTATIDDGSCIFSNSGCTDPQACNYNPEATDDDGSCEYESCAGCTDPQADNYDPTATIDDGSCTYTIEGCTDQNACNFDPEANVDDGSCEYDSCTGCTDDGACNYDPTATIDDGSCDYSCLGCTDPEACNFDQTATIDDGSCDYSCQGCTDPEACNYDANATEDDGSCEYVSCAGCTDPTALNYDPEALIDDGSCIFECILPTVSVVESGCADGDNEFFIEVNATNLGNGAPYLITNSVNGNATVLSQTGVIQYGPFSEGSIVDVSITSQSLDDCSITFPGIDCPIGITESALALTRVYPNPANATLTLEGTMTAKTEVRVLSATGQIVHLTEWSNDQTTLRLDVSAWAAGVYTIALTSENAVVHHRVVVQH
jgi:hypothetical protein